MFKKISPLDYAFAIGKIRALEKFLIKDEVFKQAIESDLSEALRLIVESNLYSEQLLSVSNSDELESILEEESSRIKKLIQSLLLDKQFLSIVECDGLFDLKMAARRIGSRFLEDYFMHAVDMHNIKTFLRLYIFKEPASELKRHLIYEGFIKTETFLKCYSHDISIFLNRLEFVHKHASLIDYASFLKDAIKTALEDSSFISLEKAINDFLIQVLKPAKYLSFGPEPVIAYYFAKVNELNLIRLIILAKLNNLTMDLVKERLNNVYA